MEDHRKFLPPIREVALPISNQTLLRSPLPAVPALAAPDPNSRLALTTVDRRELGPHDIHTVRGDWALKRYPLVPGHEIARIVTSVGTAVKTRTVGDRVGVGCLVNSCRACAACVSGQEQHCDHTVGTYGSLDRDGTTTQEGYSRYIVVSEAFTVLMPETLGLDEAAPLLCAGITTFSPLIAGVLAPAKKVFGVGFGGLGHIAVKIARAMGSEVIVLSQSLKKQEDGLRLGADHHFATNDEATFAVLEGSFDLIINTASAVIDLIAAVLHSRHDRRRGEWLTTTDPWLAAKSSCLAKSTGASHHARPAPIGTMENKLAFWT